MCCVERICSLCIQRCLMVVLSRVARCCCHRHHHLHRHCHHRHFLSIVSVVSVVIIVRTTKMPNDRMKRTCLRYIHYMYAFMFENTLFMCAWQIIIHAWLKQWSWAPSPKPDVWILAHVFAFGIYWYRSNNARIIFRMWDFSLSCLYVLLFECGCACHALPTESSRMPCTHCTETRIKPSKHCLLCRVKCYK